MLFSECLFCLHKRLSALLVGKGYLYVQKMSLCCLYISQNSLPLPLVFLPPPLFCNFPIWCVATNHWETDAGWCKQACSIRMCPMLVYSSTVPKLCIYSWKICFFFTPYIIELLALKILKAESYMNVQYKSTHTSLCPVLSCDCSYFQKQK